MIQDLKPLYEWKSTVAQKAVSIMGNSTPMTKGNAVKGIRPIARSLSYVQWLLPW